MSRTVIDRVAEINLFGGNGHAECQRNPFSVDGEPRDGFRLTLAVDSDQPNSFCGVSLHLDEPVDATACNAVALTARGRNGHEVFEFKLKELGAQEAREDMIVSRNVLNMTRTWERHLIPLDLFKTVDRAAIAHIIFASNSNYSAPLQVLDIAAIEFVAAEPEELTAKQPEIFVVHGHDTEMRDDVARAIEEMGLTPIVLQELPSGSATVHEKLKEHANVGFAVVLLSPDDRGYPAHAPDQERFRARQNVIFELGYFLSRLGPEKVAALLKSVDDFEIPSDFAGVLYIPYDNSGYWKQALARELRHVGYVIRNRG